MRGNEAVYAACNLVTQNISPLPPLPLGCMKQTEDLWSTCISSFFSLFSHADLKELFNLISGFHTPLTQQLLTFNDIIHSP